MFEAINSLLSSDKPNSHLTQIEKHLQAHDMRLTVHYKSVKYVNFRVKPNKLYVSAPKYITSFELAKILEKRLDWAIATHEKLQQRQATPSHIKDKTLQDGDFFQLWGNQVTLKLAFNVQELKHNRCQFQLSDDKNQFTISFANNPTHYEQAVIQASIQDVLILLFKQELSEHLPALMQKWQAKVGKTANEVRLKKMHTRWGTCNVRAKRVWLSAYLAQYPLACTDYVIVHELCHLHEANHSKRFWSQVEKAMPEYQQWHDYLKGTGRSID